jgi:NADH-quinone oxidoreductase subunit J
MTTRLLRSVVGLAVVSVILSILLFRLESPLAAVFELSVCAGLIPVIFITTISFTQRLSPEQYVARRKERLLRFWLLPFLIVITGILLSRFVIPPDFMLPKPPVQAQDVRIALWKLRHLDLLGQIMVILAGAFGVVILFKEKKSER